VFDATVVIISFVVDVVFLKGLQDFATEDALFILSFLLPWRVIRVVNSTFALVVHVCNISANKLFPKQYFQQTN